MSLIAAFMFDKTVIIVIGMRESLFNVFIKICYIFDAHQEKCVANAVNSPAVSILCYL